MRELPHVARPGRAFVVGSQVIKDPTILRLSLSNLREKVIICFGVNRS